MKKVVLCLSVFSLILNANTNNSYKDLANNFLNYIGETKNIYNLETLNKDGQDIGIVVNLKNSGYILFSTSENLTPIKGYSLDRNFNDLPLGYKDFLLNELNNKKNYRKVNNLNKKRWNFLKNYKFNKKRVYEPSTNLLSTNWNQDFPYNKYLPKKDGELVVTGCVNTAMSQVMKYYKYPKKGNGVASYKWNGKILKTVLNHKYNWDNMPDSLISENVKNYEIDTVATLMKDIGITNATSFDLLRNGGSGATINLTTLIENFGYSKNLKEIENSDSRFFTILKEEIDNERPVLLSFPTHLTVADGYKSDDLGDKIHINMGWGGSANDFYFIDKGETITAGSHKFATSSPNLSMVYNIKPCSQNNGDCYINLENEDLLIDNKINGKFNYNSDTDRFVTYLNGDTIINGDRGYSNQAFFISVFDSDNNLIIEDDKPIKYNFTKGKYYIKSSLCSSVGFCYNYENDEFSNYELEIISNIVTEDEKNNFDLSEDKPPIIEITNLKDTFLKDEKKIFVNIYDENDDNLDIKIYSDSSIKASYSNTILTLQPLEINKKSKVIIEVTAKDKIVQKSFNILTVDSDIYFGKEFSVTGSFEDQDTLNEHKVVLDGQCQVKGFNGYSNQAFYTKVTGGDMSDTMIDSYFKQDSYYLLASLLQNPETGYGGYYPFSDDSKNYTLTINCPNANEDIDNIAKLLDIKYKTEEVIVEEEKIVEDKEIIEEEKIIEDKEIVEEEKIVEDKEIIEEEKIIEDKEIIEEEKIVEDEIIVIQNLETNLTISSGWNLISLPTENDLNLSNFSDYKVIWKYTNNSWIKNPKTISKGEGFWINSEIDKNYNFIGNSYKLDFSNLKNGWNLVGTGENISKDELSNFEFIWKYINGKWLNKNEIKSIKAGEGFWIK